MLIIIILILKLFSQLIWESVVWRGVQQLLVAVVSNGSTRTMDFEKIAERPFSGLSSRVLCSPTEFTVTWVVKDGHTHSRRSQLRRFLLFVDGS